MRAHVNDDGGVTFEDPIGHGLFEIYDDGQDIVISPATGGGSPIWIRKSDVASIADWLRRRCREHDWRLGVDPSSTSIPLEDP